MRILIFGATGRTGRELVFQALRRARRYLPRAYDAAVGCRAGNRGWHAGARSPADYLAVLPRRWAYASGTVIAIRTAQVLIVNVGGVRSANTTPA